MHVLRAFLLLLSNAAPNILASQHYAPLCLTARPWGAEISISISTAAMLIITCQGGAPLRAPLANKDTTLTFR